MNNWRKENLGEISFPSLFLPKEVPGEYSDSEENLIESEKDTLEGMPKTNEDEKKSDGSKMNGIIVKFTLPTSAYATMALREFMHKNETE